jgi:hypothetical protein
MVILLKLRKEKDGKRKQKKGKKKAEWQLGLSFPGYLGNDSKSANWQAEIYLICSFLN